MGQGDLTGPLLIVLAGLPGTGKSTIARALAARIGAVWLRIDSIEGALARSALRIDRAEDGGYLAAYALAADNLAIGRTVVADSVNPIAMTRSAWREVAADARCPCLEVEVVCRNAAVHRARVEARFAACATGREPDWARVVARTYEAHPSADLVIDTATRAVDEAIGVIVEAIARER